MRRVATTLTLLLCASLALVACAKPTREPSKPPIVCVDSGNEIPLDDTCTDVVTRNCDDPQDCYFTSAVAVTCTDLPDYYCPSPVTTVCLLERSLSYEVSGCFSCGVKASLHINISNRCATTLDLLAVDLIPEMTPYWPIDLAQEREEGLRCLIDRLHYMTISCDPEIPCLDVEVAGQCETP